VPRIVAARRPSSRASEAGSSALAKRVTISRSAPANPVLVVGNQFDPATRYAGAQTVAATLPGARLLTLHAWGHTSGFLSGCADEAIARYLLDGTLPPVGTVCDQDEVPFAQ
jgi:hypothetical protein